MPSPQEIYLHRRYWHRSILIPLWTQQFLLQLVGVVFFWAAITIFWGGGPSHGPTLKPKRGEQVILGTFFVLYLSLTLGTLGEILLYCAGALQPKGYLLSQLLKTSASVGIWASLILWPRVIKDPIVSRLQAAIGIEAIFVWLQIPMLSSLVHGVLVWREERRIKREIGDHQTESVRTAADHADLPRMSSFGYLGRPRGTLAERQPLLSPSHARVIGGGRQRSGSIA